jgi:hypothetical protein
MPGQVLPPNPAYTVRGPKYVVQTGRTPSVRIRRKGGKEAAIPLDC